MNTVAKTHTPSFEDTAFVQFWNDVLAPKFIRFKHVLVDGLTQHSEAVFPSLPVRSAIAFWMSAAVLAIPRSSWRSLSAPKARLLASTAATRFLNMDATTPRLAALTT